MKITTGYNSGLAKGGVLCFSESLVLNPSLVLSTKVSAKNPALRQAADRWQTFWKNRQNSKN